MANKSVKSSGKNIRSNRAGIKQKDESIPNIIEEPIRVIGDAQTRPSTKATGTQKKRKTEGAPKVRSK